MRPCNVSPHPRILLLSFTLPTPLPLPFPLPLSNHLMNLSLPPLNKRTRHFLLWFAKSLVQFLHTNRPKVNPPYHLSTNQPYVTIATGFRDHLGPPPHLILTNGGAPPVCSFVHLGVPYAMSPPPPFYATLRLVVLLNPPSLAK